ncbi:hypothetical protein C0J52_05299 [Blattella germanica]|nr:hypothetical protein C0J52_05299 [Blattella germanica]
MNLSPADAAKAVALIEDGRSFRYVADRLRKSLGSVHRAVKRLLLTVRSLIFTLRTCWRRFLNCTAVVCRSRIACSKMNLSSTLEVALLWPEPGNLEYV